jgi:carboxylesterase type B
VSVDVTNTGAAANAYWAAFARTGDPNDEGRPKWKARLDVIERFAAP